MNRREVVMAGVLAALLPVASRGQSRREFVDSAGRKVAIPARIERIYAAGPPASILVFAVAPEKLLGWTSAVAIPSGRSYRRGTPISRPSGGSPAVGTPPTPKWCSAASPT